MAKSACLILGSVLVLQIPIALGDVSVEQTTEAAVVPMFHEEHSKELIDGGVQNEVAPEQMARFIYQRTRELLPVPFKGRAHRVARALIESANEHEMDPVFLMAVIEQESKFNPEALGSHGEIGLMQLKPSTAEAFASTDDVVAELRDPAQNVRLGAAYLAQLRNSFKRRASLYISAYNMGAARVRETVASGVQPHIYSSAVLAHYVELAGGIPQTVAAARPELQVFNRTLAL